MRFTWKSVSDVLSDKELMNALGGEGYGEGYEEANCCREGRITLYGTPMYYDRLCNLKQSYCDGIAADPDFSIEEGDDWCCGPTC